MLLFDCDLQVGQEIMASFLQAQAWLGPGRKSKAGRGLQKALRRDPSHALAAHLIHEIK